MSTRARSHPMRLGTARASSERRVIALTRPANNMTVARRNLLSIARRRRAEHFAGDQPGIELASELWPGIIDLPES